MKYKNKKIIYNGIKFDSRKEYKRYCELALLEKVGQITNLRMQETFELLPARYENYERYSKKTGKRLTDGRRCVERAVCYKADFVYEENGKTVVEDTKGFKTKDYILKRKMMLYFHNIKIKEI